MFVGISALRRAAGGALVAALAGCYQSTAPPRWLATPVDAQREAFGSWIRVHGESNAPPLAEGELIAVDADSIHVLADNRLVSLARQPLCCAELTAFQTDLADLQYWTALGTVSTLSHGFVLIASAPSWLLAGTLATASASRASRVASTNPAALRPFARFPQGIPPGLDRTTIRPKPR